MRCWHHCSKVKEAIKRVEREGLHANEHITKKRYTIDALGAILVIFKYWHFWQFRHILKICHFDTFYNKILTIPWDFKKIWISIFRRIESWQCWQYEWYSLVCSLGVLGWMLHFADNVANVANLANVANFANVDNVAYFAFDNVTTLPILTT